MVKITIGFTSIAMFLAALFVSTYVPDNISKIGYSQVMAMFAISAAICFK